jgi:hypothetical protein
MIFRQRAVISFAELFTICRGKFVNSYHVGMIWNDFLNSYAGIIGDGSYPAA